MSGDELHGKRSTCFCWGARSKRCTWERLGLCSPCRFPRCTIYYMLRNGGHQNNELNYLFRQRFVAIHGIRILFLVGDNTRLVSVDMSCNTSRLDVTMKWTQRCFRLPPLASVSRNNRFAVATALHQQKNDTPFCFF